MIGGGNRLVIPDAFVVDPVGVPIAGAQLFTYATGTNTPQNTFSDAALTIPNTNPIVADSAGRFGNVFLVLSPAYRMVLEDANNVPIWDFDPVGPSVAATGAVPIGGMVAFAGTAAPAGWLLCFGQAVSRSTYSDLFSVIGTTYGIGDGSTTFNLPDKRGRVSVGKDDMGGVAANRITSGTAGFSGVTLGAAGGDQNFFGHNHAVADPGHNHTLTDPSHHHQQFYTGSFPGHGVPEGGVSNAVGPGTRSPDMQTDDASTGITIASSFTGYQVFAFGSGVSQNVQPSQVDNVIIFTG